MRKLLLTLCGVAVLSSVSSFTSAEGGYNHGKMTEEQRQKMKQRRTEFRKKLNLNPEQQEKMKALREASRVKMKSLHEQLRREKAKLKQLREGGASEEEIKLQRQKIHKAKARKKEIIKANFEKMQTFLTPDQQKEFNKMHEEHKKKMKNKFKNKKFKFGSEKE